MSSVDPYIYIIIAVVGLAYPILLQAIARLDEKYESENVSELFKSEFEWTAFRYTLYISLVSIFIWSLKLEPWFKIDGLDFIIENSASMLVGLNTILLVISFFFFVTKVLRYYNPFSFIPYLIEKHEKSEDGVKYFTVLSDLLLLSIKRQQTNLSVTLSGFFYSAFRKIRDKFPNEPLVYPDLYYKTIYQAIEELAILKEKRNYLLEHRTSGGIWLLGELQGKEISENTYAWLWRNLLLAVRYQRDDLIVNHWETCHQYYVYSLPYIYQEYDGSAGSFQVSNEETVNKRIAERKRFIEFHFVLGGLLTYKEWYACIKRLFSYTQSQPPKYELLPESMSEIFKFYFDIRDPYDRKYTWISHQYPFPELSGINSDYVIKKWIMSYMAILFLRQYTIVPYLITMRPLDFPPTPDTQGEIKQWIGGLDIFKKLVSEHLQNKELLKNLNLDFITTEWCDENRKPYPIAFIETFKTTLERAYDVNALILPISDEKVSQFENSTRRIIESAIDKLQPINNELPIGNDNSDKWYVNGHTMLQSKDAFSETPEAHHVDFDSFLAFAISSKLNEGLGEVFIRKMSISYLLKQEDFFKAIDKLAIDENYVIVDFGIRLDDYINRLNVPGLSKEKYKDINIYSYNRSSIVNDSFFILKKSYLPNISTKPISEEIIGKYNLKRISDRIDLYTSVIDLNDTTVEIFGENKQDISDEDLKKMVLLSIFISTEFKWKKGIDVIQLRQYSEFLQKGTANKLDDVNPVNQ